MEDADWIAAHDLIKQLKPDCKNSCLDGECQHVNVILDDGNYFCSACNILMDRHIDQGAEWRFYGAEQKGSDPTRCGMPASDLLPNSSLSSIIGFSSNEKHDVRMMRKYHMWNSMSYKDRSLFYIFEGISLTAQNSGIPKSIIDEAKMLYKCISDMKLSRGENRSGLIASSIYIACKKNKVPRSAKEIAKIFNLESDVMTRSCKKFQDMLKLNMEATHSTDFINRFCSKLDMDDEKKHICGRMTQLIDKYEILSENTPPSVAAGTIFLCSTHYDWDITKKSIYETCEISQVTISKCYKKLVPYKEQLFKNLLLD
jgi:transcription initiation factor TFIIB